LTGFATTMLRSAPAKLAQRGLCTTNDHYAAVRESYHRAWFYAKDSPYEKWQLDCIVETLGSGLDSEEARIADIGGGTGRFAGLLHQKLDLKQKVLCVDMSEEMLKEAQKVPGVSTKCADAASFAASLEPKSFDRFLLKEIVHHLGFEECAGMYKDLARGLQDGGRCVTVTRPKYEFEYPMFDAARKVWELNQEDASLYAGYMRDAGFNDVRCSVLEFPVTMQLKDWTNMVKIRMWSTFSESHFSEKKLLEGIKEIEEKYPTDLNGNVSFNEKIVLIQGSV